MTVSYELRVHVRDVTLAENGFGDVGNHTGYDLIITHEDGSRTIQYIDLYKDGGNINFYISNEILAHEYTITEGNQTRSVVWGETTFQNNASIATTENYLKSYKADAVRLLTGSSALNAFNKIKLEASILSQLSSKLDYNPMYRNCNTCTNYFAQKYLGGANVFSQVPYGIYQGWYDPFYNSNSLNETDVTIKKVDDLLNKFYSVAGSNVDLSDVTSDIITQSGGWYVKISSGDKNYLFSGFGNTNIADGDGDSVIFAEDGENLINSGSGKDTIYIKNGSTVYAGAGSDIVYARGNSNDIKAGEGSDVIALGVGENIVDLGNDNAQDWLYTSNAAGSVTIVKNATSEDVIYMGGIRSRTVEGRDVILLGYNGNKVILKDYMPEEEENPDGNGNPFGNAPLPTMMGDDGRPYGYVPGAGYCPMWPVGEVPTLFRCVAANDFDCGFGNEEIKFVA